MTLTATEKVYQADMMHLTPASDSQIYGYQGNWVLRGLELDILANRVVLHAGAAILQGRLYENSGDVTLSLTGITGTYYVGLRVDLSKTNPDANTNNQYTLVATQTPPSGDLLSGNIQAFIALYTVAGSGPVRTVWPYKEDLAITSFNSGYANNSDYPVKTRVERRGESCVLYGNIAKTSSSATNVLLTLPRQFRPLKRVVGTAFVYSTNGGVVSAANLAIHDNGTIELIRVNFDVNTPIQFAIPYFMY